MMKHGASTPKLLTRIYFVLASLAVSFLIIFINYNSAAASELQNRSVQLSSYTPSAISAYQFGFVVPSTSILGSIVFDYCSNSALLDDPCTAPAGLDVSSANLSSQSGNTAFSIDSADTTVNKLVIKRVALVGSIITSTYNFSNITNPSTIGTTVFVRISTYSSTDGTGPLNDNGTVAFVTASHFTVGAFVPPFLKLCVGVSVAPDCSSLSGDSINLGILSPNHANAGQSQFATGTNSPSGYAIYSLGTTMTSGNNIIPALAIPTTNFPDTGQFGINLRANLSPPIGEDPVGTGTAAPTANYNTPNRYMFSDGDSIVLASLPTNYNRMTVSYLVNVPSNQFPGVYSTTITYLAVAQF